jgi:succinoglycan biosynthesis protein ExoM
VTTLLPHVSVCVCTLGRPLLLQRLLIALLQQRTENRFTFSIIVTDNDQQQSARGVVEAFATKSAIATTYGCEPRKNIALARNDAVHRASGDYIAFIDDDEFPRPDWLLTMLAAIVSLDAAGVLGPVRPHFDQPPPQWLVDGEFCERPEHSTGHVMDWRECRTGNVLLRQAILPKTTPAFDERLGTGGEDVDFFSRMTAQGHIFRWCNEGAVYETVPPERWTRGYMFRRALLRGRNTLKLGTTARRAKLLLTSLVAVPVYTMVLPFAALLGQHVFIRYGIRFCDHAGRLLGALRLNPVKTR